MNRKSVRNWIMKAESGLKAGKDEFATPDPATDTVCFHRQQCAEKYLKAFLIFHGKEITRTHIIEEIVRECMTINPDFQELFDTKAATLTDFAVEIRYPGVFMFPTVGEAREAIEIAERVKEFVLTKLRSAGFKPWT